MFFDQVTLSRKSWHYKLQSFFFGKPPFTQNFCPYFWLTIFCLIAATVGSPFYLAFKAFVIVGTLLYHWVLNPMYHAMDALASKIEDTVCRPIAENHFRGFDDRTIYLLSKKAGWRPQYGGIDRYAGEGGSKFRKKFYRWAELMGADWKERVKAAWDKESERQKIIDQKDRDRMVRAWKLEDERKAARQKRQQSYANLVKYTKWVVVPTVVAFAAAVFLAVLYLAVRLVIILCSKWNGVAIWAAIVKVAPIAGIMMGCAAVILALVFGVIKLMKCLRYLDFPSLPTIPQDRLDQFGEGFLKLIGKIAAPFQIFIEYVKVFKQNHCPAINWKEE